LARRPAEIQEEACLWLPRRTVDVADAAENPRRFAWDRGSPMACGFEGERKRQPMTSKAKARATALCLTTIVRSVERYPRTLWERPTAHEITKATAPAQTSNAPSWPATLTSACQ
jgi:hypothetical protein